MGTKRCPKSQVWGSYGSSGDEVSSAPSAATAKYVAVETLLALTLPASAEGALDPVDKAVVMAPVKAAEQLMRGQGYLPPMTVEVRSPPA